MKEKHKEFVKIIGKCSVHPGVDCTSAMVFIEKGLDYIAPLCQPCMEELWKASNKVNHKDREWFDAWLTLRKAKENKP